MKATALLAILASVLVAGCTTTAPPATSGGTPPTMHVIEGRPDPASAIDALDAALNKLKNEQKRVAALEEDNAKIRVERDTLQRNLSDVNRTLLALQMKVDTLTRDSQDSMDALLACEIEKATLERRLLEIKLADLRKVEEDGAR